MGRTADEAIDLLEKFHRLEDAGAWAVEVEVVPQEVMAEINQRTSLITFSLGAGPHADVNYLFASDIMGESENPPRHAKCYGRLRELREEMQAERVRSMKAFVADAESGEFPPAELSVRMKPEELAAFRERLES